MNSPGVQRGGENVACPLVWDALRMPTLQEVLHMEQLLHKLYCSQSLELLLNYRQSSHEPPLSRTRSSSWRCDAMIYSYRSWLSSPNAKRAMTRINQLRRADDHHDENPSIFTTAKAYQATTQPSWDNSFPISFNFSYPKRNTDCLCSASMRRARRPYSISSRYAQGITRCFNILTI